MDDASGGMDEGDGAAGASIEIKSFLYFRVLDDWS
jgi:hypothetical protein